MPLIHEHSIKLNITLPRGDVHAKMETFYNPLMVSNRNLAILLLNSIENTNLNIVDHLAGSGVRSLRFLKELQPDKINHLFINDKNPRFKKVFKQHLTLNKISKPLQKKITLGNQEASLFLLNRINDNVKPSDFCGYADYIELDPFGSPNPFLSAAIARISRHGILAITATDTAALTGTYPKVTQRKYWSTPLKNYMMHEIGLRILIRKIQLLGVQFDKALTPLLSYHKDHYFRIYLQSEKGKEHCDDILKQHQYFLSCPNCLNFKTSLYNNETCICQTKFQYAGPLWIGKLHNQNLIQKISENNTFPEEQKFVSLLKEEASQDSIGFYDLHEIARILKRNPHKMEDILKFPHITRTHFSPTGIKTNKSLAEIINLIKSLSS